MNSSEFLSRYGVPRRSPADGMDVTAPRAIFWPSGVVPIEVFETITSHISRCDHRNLRLVNKEFDSKVSASYFKNVVIPFRSELYKELSQREGGMSSGLISNGLRIFQSFGPHILRFALSLEIDEDALAYPPIKSTQEAVTSFWGIYRWPHQLYNRYSDLEGIERTADETVAMRSAMKCLTKVTNLGLCCDAGLGFLIRPDLRSASSVNHHPVFTQDRDKRRFRARQIGGTVTVSDFNGNRAMRKKASPKQLKLSVLKKMVADAGYQGQVQDAIDLLLVTEKTDLASINFDEVVVNATCAADPQASDNTDDAQTPEPNELTAKEQVKFPLAPSMLTSAQKELLLELDWAHRAMIQSFVLGIYDNLLDGRFEYLTTLTIAKIPSSHVHILYRAEFWDSFPALTTVSLGVVADWRRICKLAPGCIEDEPVSPVEAVGKVYKLLNNYIGTVPRIKSLHFEWICGGEFGPGYHQRNRYILPAPFFENPDLMISSTCLVTGNIPLQLPHIKHLSLKNCWSPPHALLQVLRSMALSSLESLELETLSLSGPPSTRALPSPPTQAFNHTLVPRHPNHEVPPHSLSPGPLAIKVRYPDLMTWAGLLEHFSPNTKIRFMIQSFGIVTGGNHPLNEQMENLVSFIPDARRLIDDENRYKLKRIGLKSCGYVSVDSPYLDNRVVLGPGMFHGSTIPAKSSRSLKVPPRIMQRCQDNRFGITVAYMCHQERINLLGAWRMTRGWRFVYSDIIIRDALVDGVEQPGCERFSGIIESSGSGSWRGYERQTAYDPTHYGFQYNLDIEDTEDDDGDDEVDEDDEDDEDADENQVVYNNSADYGQGYQQDGTRSNGNSNGDVQRGSSSQSEGTQ